MRDAAGVLLVDVRRDADWEEFQVVLVGKPAATYHTDDRQDAMQTARVMFTDELIRRQGCVAGGV